MPIDPRAFRRTVGLFATGVTVITVQVDEVIHGMTANSFTSISLDPLLVLVSIDRRARMGTLIEQAGRFSVNLLSAAQQNVSRHFAGRPEPELVITFEELDSLPRLPGALGALACTNHQILDGGDHIIVLGQVDALWQNRDASAPLLYYSGHYRTLAPDSNPAATNAEMDFLHHNILSFG